MSPHQDQQRRHRMVSTSKGSIEVVTVGSGRPCLVLHGGHGSCFDPFGVGEALRAEMMAIVPSRPGYGRTDIAVGETPATAADSLVEMLGRLGLSTCSVIGVSAAGPTAISLAARHPDVVDRLVLESAVADVWMEPTSAKRLLARVLFDPRVEATTWRANRAFARMAQGLAIRSLLPSLTTLKAKAALAELDEPDCEHIIDMMGRQRSGHGFVLDLAAEVAATDLRAIAAPTLIVHSKHDGAVPIDHARRAALLITNSQLVELGSWGHLIWLGRNSEEILDDVAAFLSVG